MWIRDSCNGAELNLNLNIFLSVREKNGYRNDNVKTSVAVFFRRFYVVLHRKERHVVLRNEHLRNLVNVVDKRADYADTGNVVDVFEN